MVRLETKTKRSNKVEHVLFFVQAIFRLFFLTKFCQWGAIHREDSTPHPRSQRGIQEMPSCRRPNLRIYNEKEYNENGKHPTIKFIRTPSDVDIIKKHNLRYYEEWEEKEAKWIKEGSGQRLQKIPCGQCFCCRLEYSKQWATRCTLEAIAHPDWQNYFITLTYDEKNKPKTKSTKYKLCKDTYIEYKDDGTWNGYLEPKDLTKFIKDLRAYYKYHYNHDGIRFFACGEYGSKGQRPHYHLIIFNLPLNLKKIDRVNVTKWGKEPVWYSQEIDQIWGKGLVAIGEVTWSSCAYVARYMMKKQKGNDEQTDKEYYLKKGQTPEFVRMSRMPGIGSDYYDINRDKIYFNDEIIMKTIKENASSIKPPKFYDRKFDIDNPEMMEAIKKKRKESMERAEKARREKETYTYYERLQIDARTMQEKGLRLKRGLE